MGIEKNTPGKGGCPADSGRNLMFGFKSILVQEVQPVIVNVAATTTTTTAACLALDFGAASVSRNNLGGHGPDREDNANGLHIRNVATVDGVPVNLVVTAANEYVPNNAGANGVWHDFARINAKCGTSTQFNFDLINSQTGGAIKVDRLCISFADLDEGLDDKCEESVKLSGFDSYYVSDDTQIVAEAAEGGQTTFVASTHGTGADNPRKPQSMNELATSRTVGVSFSDVSSFSATFTWGEGPYGNGRDIFFAGPTPVMTGADANALKAPLGL
jgi:hypothetical protein